ncbi:DUF4303 domain-containing protein [Saccharibacillus sp. CPCC 101409]|uniref:DUF4303 domain-containing protein n=1 Tax=Saccharibacillus sp. CPCC 101409 TaxID=3058041 RepID=UPI0026738F13|nr:DUF4303 domain-containing protein [Saccharibacillus sp. CPCC 101409]MDO3412446.1 DUF4303 domain-containing protein [Saccharibacillus sp. CPCC 101409]
MTDFLNRFETHFKANFLQDLTDTLAQAQHEKVYACAFGTDSDFTTLFLAVNTEESLARHIADMKQKGLCESEASEIYYRWGISEYQYGDETHFNGISDVMYEAENAYDHKDAIVSIIAGVVRDTDESVFRAYGQSKADIVFFVSMTDDDEAEALENETVVQMTDAELAKNFLKRYDR